jgi:putative ABC transport system permease protein
MFRFSIGNAFRRKGIMVLALVGVGLGVALMSTLRSLSDGIDQRVESTFNQLAADIVVTPADSPFGAFLGGGTPLPADYLAKITKLPNVEIVYPQVVTTIPSSVIGSKLPIGVQLTGIDPKKDPALNGPTINITEGRCFSKEGEVIVGYQIKEQSRFTGVIFNLGQEIKVPIFNEQGFATFPDTATASAAPSSSRQTNKNATASAVPTQTKNGETVVNLKVVGFFQTNNALFDRSLYTDLDTARKLAKLGDGKFSSIRVRANSVDNVNKLGKDIESALKNGEVEVSVNLSKDVLGNVNDTLNIFRDFLLVVGLIAAVAGGISIFIIMLMSVIERQKEFGILKAAGWSNFNILFSVIVESVTIGVLGSLIGLLVGFGATKLIEHYLEEGTAVYSLNLIFFATGFGILMGVLGGLYPAIRATRVTPMETLKAL